ncbi:MAG: vWA domain-containing protein [Planctomycetota bacterium]
MAFENSYYVLLLVPVGAAVAAMVFLRRWRRRRGPAMRFPSLELAAGVPTTIRARASAWVWVLRAAALVSLVFALARPRRGIETVYDTTRGVDIALCLDVSGSMRQPIELTRASGARSKIDATKRVAADFVDRRAHDRIALVPFAKFAYRLCPLTLHHGWVKEQLARIRIKDSNPRSRRRGDPDEDAGLIDETQTAVGTALSVATNALRDSDAKSKVVILLTDGRSNFGKLEPLEAADIAKQFGVRVYTIGAGASIEDFRRARMFMGNYAPIDEETLRDVARRTGGRYFRARDEASLARVYEEIDKLEKTEIDSVRHQRFSEHFAWLATPAMVLVWLEIAAALTVLRRTP